MASENSVEGEWQQVGWRSPSNIALIKYWGKAGWQIPMNPSLSFTLSNAYTETVLLFKKKKVKNKKIEFLYLFEGNENYEFSDHIKKYLNNILSEFPFLADYYFRFESKNSFPHSAGIASSASSMSALALCLCSIELQINKTVDSLGFYQKASHTARMGSGSASRSVYGGFNAWEKHMS